MSTSVEKSAGAVIFRRESSKPYYLLLRYNAGHWDFPKGNIEQGEKPEDAARREIKEETGIEDIEFFPGFKENIKYFYKFEGKTILKVVAFYLAKTNTKDIKISWEHKGFAWLLYEEALGRITFNNSKEILKKANEYLSEQGLSNS